jgi:hypothetical protein
LSKTEEGFMQASFRNAGLGIAAIALALFSTGGPALAAGV